MSFLERTPTRVLSTLPTSDVSVAVKLPRAEPLQLEALSPALRIPSVSGEIVRLGRGRLGRHLTAERCVSFFSDEGEARVVQHRRLLRVDLAARAREHISGFSFARCSPRCWFSGFAPAASRPFGSRTTSGPCSTRQRIAFPRDPSGALFPSTSLERRSRRARPPPLARCPARRAGAPGTRGSVPVATPVHRPMSAAHGCCFQRRSPQVSAHVASSLSHVMRELAVPRRNAHFGEPLDRARSIVRSDRVSNDVPLIPRRRGRPWRSYVHQRRPAIAHAISGRRPEA